jgi:hypothetical protein
MGDDSIEGEGSILPSEDSGFQVILRSWCLANIRSVWVF